MRGPNPGFAWNGWWTVLILSGVAVAAIATIATRLRRMEVVA